MGIVVILVLTLLFQIVFDFLYLRCKGDKVEKVVKANLLWVVSLCLILLLAFFDFPGLREFLFYGMCGSSDKVLLVVMF